MHVHMTRTHNRTPHSSVISVMKQYAVKRIIVILSHSDQRVPHTGLMRTAPAIC